MNTARDLLSISPDCEYTFHITSRELTVIGLSLRFKIEDYMFGFLKLSDLFSYLSLLMCWCLDTELLQVICCL